MPNKYGKCTRDFGAFLFLLVSTFLYLGGVFNKTILLLALVARRIIVKYNNSEDALFYRGFTGTITHS